MTTPFEIIAWHSLTLHEQVGKGSFGTVHRGSLNGREVAIKSLHLTTLTSDLMAEFQNETSLMAECRSDHIVRLLGICREKGHLAMIMEFMSKGSLYSVLGDQKINLIWKTRYKIALGTGMGIAYLHQRSIIHRDLKSLNVLLDQDFNPKICDFGMSKIKLTSNSTNTNSFVGSLCWLAPELFQRLGKHSAVTDVYSYGMILWEIAARKQPYADGSLMQISDRVKNGEREEIPQDCPTEFKALIEKCWAQKPETRPTAIQVVSYIEKLMESTQPQVLQNILEKDLKMGPFIGQGSFGKVYRGEWKGREVAIKQLFLKKLAKGTEDEFKKDLESLTQCTLEQVVKIWGIINESSMLAIVTELMPGGSLAATLYDKKIELPWNNRIKIALDIAKGLAWLHKNDILHKFLKSSNVLLDRALNAKLSDIGLAAIRIETKVMKLDGNKEGNLRWLAPELFKRKAVPTKASDIYSYGIVVGEIASRTPPFADISLESQVIEKITKGDKKDLPGDTPESLKNIILDSSLGDPTKRPSIDKIIADLEQKPREYCKFFAGHQGLVSSLAFLADGTLVSGSWDKTVRLWNTDSGEMGKTFTTSAPIEGVILLDNKTLALASEDKILIYDPHTNGIKKSYNVGSIKDLFLLKDSCFLLKDDLGFTVFNTTSNSIVFKHFVGSYIDDWVMGIDSTLWYTAERRIFHVDLTSKKMIRSFALESPVDKLTISSDKKVLIGASSRGTLMIWDTYTGALKDRLPAFNQNIFSVALLDDRFIATGTDQGKIPIWDLISKKLIHTFVCPLEEIRVLTFHNGWLFSGSYEGSIRSWDCSSILS